MILPSLRRFYSTPIKPKANLNPNPFALGRPVSKRQPKPAARTPDPPRNPKSSTDGEIARPNLSPLSKKIQQWRRDLSDRKGADGLAEVGVENGHDWTFNSILQILRQCALYSLGIFVVGHLFITHVFDLQATLGASMLPTLYYEGDWVLINKLYRRGKGVQVGDLVEAKNPLRADGRVLKRVIGMPGDFVVAHTTDTDGMMLQVRLFPLALSSGHEAD